MKEYLDMIPPEQAAIIAIALTGLIGAIIGFFSWLFTKYFPRWLDSRMSASETRIKMGFENERLKIQAELDETQNNREMLRLQSSEMVESRNAFLKIIEAMREDSKKRDEQASKFLNETAESYRGIQSNTAATLELLKLHQEVDEAMTIGQTKVHSQNEKTHEQNGETHKKLAAIATDLAFILAGLKDITVGRASDRSVIDDIQKKVEKVQDGLKHLEDEIAKAKLETPVTTVESSPILKEVVSEKKEENNEQTP